MVLKCLYCNNRPNTQDTARLPYLGKPRPGELPRYQSRMLEITASGSSYEIGFTHGQQAKLQVARCIDFYSGLFRTSAKLEWPEVRKLALDKFEPNIKSKWPDYHDEMRGIADGAEVELSDIIAINVRTEISFGLFSDGCTALSWLTSQGQSSFLAQNWDWMTAQKENLVLLTIHQSGSPSKAQTIKMVTEAGLIGKIGFNSSGVGVLLNAIKAKGMDATRLPCHLGLRMVLDSVSRDDAVRNLEKYGVASSCHMLVADGERGGTGLEWSHLGVQKVKINGQGQVFHTNHYVIDQKDVEDTNFLPDSRFRRSRIEELCHRLSTDVPTQDQIFSLFTDEDNFPGSICRSDATEDGSGSLFNIVMDLKHKTALVTQGRPVTPEWRTQVYL